MLDPFVGGGTSVVEAAKCNANVIGIDIDPVACFVTAMELSSVGDRELQEAFEYVERTAKSEILRWYKSKLPDGREATIVYAFWVDEIVCRKCGKTESAHPHYQLSRDSFNKKQVVFCPECGEVKQLSIARKNVICDCGHTFSVQKGPVKKGIFTCSACGAAAPVNSFSSRDRKPSQRLFALEVVPDGSNQRVFKKADQEDLLLYRNASMAWKQADDLTPFIPNEPIPTEGRVDRRPVSYGYRFYRELFNDRQLLALGTLAKAIANIRNSRARDFLAIAFSDALAANNMFCYYAFDYQKLTPLFGLHAYQKVTRPVENNVWGTVLGRGSFIRCFQKVVKAKHYCKKPFEYSYSENGRPKQIFTGEAISPVIGTNDREAKSWRTGRAQLFNQSSERLEQLASKSVDLILSDPPYYDNLAYSELSDFYHVWLKRLRLSGYAGNNRSKTPMAESLYVSSKKAEAALGRERFEIGLAKVFAECHRVLKDDGLFAFTFHHRAPDAWAAIASALIEANFRVTSIFPVRSEGTSQFHSSAGNIKWDVVFCCRKRRHSAASPLLDVDSRFTRHLWTTAATKSAYWKRKITRTKLLWSDADHESLTWAMGVLQLSKYKINRDAVRHLFGTRR